MQCGLPNRIREMAFAEALGRRSILAAAGEAAQPAKWRKVQDFGHFGLSGG